MIENNEKQTELVGLLKKYAQATLTREKVQSMRGYLQVVYLNGPQPM